jgi:phosphohistidine phosphatase SixA
VETAEDICAELDGNLVPEVTEVLAPGADPESLVSEIAIHHPAATEVVCTGHNPDMGTMAAWFATGRATMPFRVKTGSLVRVDVDDHDVRLTWFLPPKVVRRLAKSEKTP